jgi:hypothetical protein
VRETPRSPDGTLAQRAGNRLDREAAEKRDAAFMALADKANRLAARYHGSEPIPLSEDLADTAQGDLEAAGRGSLGLSPHVRDTCRDSIERYYAARQERAARSRPDGP